MQFFVWCPFEEVHVALEEVFKDQRPSVAKKCAGPQKSPGRSFRIRGLFFRFSKMTSIQVDEYNNSS